MDAQLQQIIELQTEQNQLLKQHLWRLKFSLLTLLLLTTATCVCLGIVMYKQNQGIRISPYAPVYAGPMPQPVPFGPPATATPVLPNVAPEARYAPTPMRQGPPPQPPVAGPAP